MVGKYNPIVEGDTGDLFLGDMRRRKDGQWVKLSEFQKQSQLLWDAFRALDHADHDERLAMLDKLKNHFDKVGKPTKTKQ
ncbi:hypothetical protein [Vibrio cholerae]|uniref:hypothetical protein n=1 Tax=Vibrio cholerae TaxID=666 RepID=UPI00067FD9E3|nr:hypothetical protein [Vibrio cholerae]